jgi:uncharacterized protein YndB with AHSA1/START domain
MTERPDDIDVIEQMVERALDLDVAMDDLWRMISEGDELETWMADDVDVEVVPGACGRITDDDVIYDVEIDEVTVGERVVWRWTPVDPTDDDTTTSRVELTIAPTPTGGRLTIVETRPAPPVATLSATSATALRWEVRAGLASMRGALHVMA